MLSYHREPLTISIPTLFFYVFLQSLLQLCDLPERCLGRKLLQQTLPVRRVRETTNVLSSRIQERSKLSLV